MEFEITGSEIFFDELDRKINRPFISRKTKKGAKLYTPFFEKFSNCELVGNRYGRMIGIRAKGDLKTQFGEMEKRLKKFAEDHGFSSDFNLIKNGLVWASLPGPVPDNFVGDVTLRFDRIICYKSRVQLKIEVVGINGDEDEEQISYMDAEMALDYLKEPNSLS